MLYHILPPCKHPKWPRYCCGIECDGTNIQVSYDGLRQCLDWNAPLTGVGQLLYAIGAKYCRQCNRLKIHDNKILTYLDKRMIRHHLVDSFMFPKNVTMEFVESLND